MSEGQRTGAEGLYYAMANAEAALRLAEAIVNIQWRELAQAQQNKEMAEEALSAARQAYAAAAGVPEHAIEVGGPGYRPRLVSDYEILLGARA